MPRNTPRSPFSVVDLKRAVAAARLEHLKVERIDITKDGNFSLKVGNLADDECAPKNEWDSQPTS
jgi:hypothetical protein